mmetsp:Transcript_13408/g.54149  ORF Transcript_13408/g.54149 Transcript_13408/m.54149 type:complete len:80 (-) Transcript_13408:1845-2084(-)
MFESKASTIIQKNWRAFAVRQNLKIIRKAAVDIQAGCRGRAGRILAHEQNLKVPRPKTTSGLLQFNSSLFTSTGSGFQS